jgi:acetyl esterase/lipase
MLRALVVLALCASSATAAEPWKTVNVWPAKPPGETKDLPAESNLWKDTDPLVDGKPLIKLANVSTPTLAIYKPAKEKDTGAAVVICPGGGHFILAYDLEGTEVAEWLNTLGVTGIVLKYRVPFRNPSNKSEAAVQDAQRAVRMVRANAKEWGLDAKRIGILGFSAGGETAGLAAINHKVAQYEAIDKVDEASGRPDFAVLVYPAYFTDKKNRLKDTVTITKETPPMFLAHSFDDPVDVRSSLLLALGSKDAGVSCELHTYASGGHGWGLRKTGHPCNSWPDRCAEWMEKQGYLKK